MLCMNTDTFFYTKNTESIPYALFKRHCQGFKEMSLLMIAAYRSCTSIDLLRLWGFDCSSVIVLFQADYSSNNTSPRFFFFLSPPFGSAIKLSPLNLKGFLFSFLF